MSHVKRGVIDLCMERLLLFANCVEIVEIGILLVSYCVEIVGIGIVFWSMH
jgi:hypothetical protein